MGPCRTLLNERASPRSDGYPDWKVTTVEHKTVDFPVFDADNHMYETQEAFAPVSYTHLTLPTNREV